MDSLGSGVSDQGRGSGCSSSASSRIVPVVRTVCYIAAELVRLVSCVESMKPVLQSLYHRILLYPPPQHRTEAIRIMKEVGGGMEGAILIDFFCVCSKTLFGCVFFRFWAVLSVCTIWPVRVWLSRKLESARSQRGSPTWTS